MSQVNDHMSETSTHGNLAVAHQALGMHEMALLHYHSHLNTARERIMPSCIMRHLSCIMRHTPIRLDLEMSLYIKISIS